MMRLSILVFLGFATTAARAFLVQPLARLPALRVPTTTRKGLELHSVVEPSNLVSMIGTTTSPATTAENVLLENIHVIDIESLIKASFLQIPATIFVLLCIPLFYAAGKGMQLAFQLGGALALVVSLVATPFNLDVACIAVYVSVVLTFLGLYSILVEYG